MTALAFGAAWGGAAWHARVQLADARRAMARGEYKAAAVRLTWLAGHRPGWGEAALRLGDCAEAQGDADGALAAWARVPASVPESDAAGLRRGRLAIDRGRFTDAEDSLRAVLTRGGPESAEARNFLMKLLWREARFPEVSALIEDRWRALESEGRLSTSAALDALRGHVALDFEAFPYDEIDAGLRRAAELAPADVNVRLARGRWALVAGRLDVAESESDACLRLDPEGRSAWRLRLDLAVAVGRFDQVRDACRHVPAAGLSAARIEFLRAWVAAHRGVATAEREALERLLTVEPNDLPALERLAERLVQDGDAERAAALRARRRVLGDARQRFRTAFQNDELGERPLALARLAHELGREFEARAFLTLAARQGQDDAGLRSALRRAVRRAPTPSLYKPGATLAEVLAPVLGPSGPPTAPRAVVRVHFRDDAVRAGLVFSYDNGATALRQLPETMNGGVALLDYDGDGWLDVYAVQGGPFPPQGPGASGDRLFRNRGDGTFEDATDVSGLGRVAGGYGHGVSVGDYDNDGYPDVFVTRWRSYALYHNRGDGTFADATERAGLGGERDWPTSAAFADLDNDGDLDLYVCHYLRWDPTHPRLCPQRSGGGYRYCDPRHFEALADHVFRNDGGRFTDVSREAGVADRDGRGLGVVAADLDGDGRTDLFVANDGTANALYRNLGGFRFEDVAHAAGVAGNAAGGYQAGMGVACGDLDGDGLPDVLVTNFYGESTTFYHNLGAGLFGDRTAAVGLAAATRSLLGFGIVLADADNDGCLDVLTANGHVNDERPQFAYAMPAQVLMGGPRGLLRDASAAAGPAWQVPRVGRGLASGDLDNDGRVDAVVVAQGTPLAYFHNESEGGHSLSLLLEGTASNRDGVGAVVTVASGNRRQTARRVGGGSYESAVDARLHFGLGASERVESVEVRWPSGQVDRHVGLPPDAGYRLREGAAQAEPLPGFDRSGSPRNRHVRR